MRGLVRGLPVQVHEHGSFFLKGKGQSRQVSDMKSIGYGKTQEFFTIRSRQKNIDIIMLIRQTPESHFEIRCIVATRIGNETQDVGKKEWVYHHSRILQLILSPGNDLVCLEMGNGSEVFFNFPLHGLFLGLVEPCTKA